jgi:hypothetical protein
MQNCRIDEMPERSCFQIGISMLQLQTVAIGKAEKTPTSFKGWRGFQMGRRTIGGAFNSFAGNVAGNEREFDYWKVFKRRM